MKATANFPAQALLSDAAPATAFFPPNGGILGPVEHLRQLLLDLRQALARISTADWSIWLSAVLTAARAFMFFKSVIS